MSLLDRLIDRPLPIFLAALLLIVLGVWSLYGLPVKRNPEVVIPFALVAATYEGASPEGVESEVAIELEEELSSVDRLRHVRSVSAEGSATLALEFEDRTDMTSSLQAVRDKADLARVAFPPEAGDVVIRELSFDDLPLVIFTVTGGSDLYRLRDIAEELKPELEGIPGVSQVDLFGGHEREVRVRVAPALLAEHGLALEDVATALRGQSRNVPAGRLRGARADRLIRATGEFETLDAIRATVVGLEGGAPILLRDLAEVTLHHRRLTSGSWSGGEPSASLIVRRRTRVNTLETSGLLEAQVDAYRDRLPAGVRIESRSSEVDIIRQMLGQLGTSAVLGIGLVVAVLLVMFGARQALLVSCVLPFSLLFACIGLRAFGMEISDVAMFGIILVLGLVVDGAIIVGEAIYREREAGHSAPDAAKRGLARVGVAVIAADLTTIAAFAPMLLMVGVMGQYMSVVPKVVIFALAGSVFVDHLLLPAAATRIQLRTARWRMPSAPDGLPWFSPELPRTRGLYLRLLEGALRHRAAVIGSAGIAFAGALALLALGAIESVFLPATDRGRFTVSYALPLGSSLAETNRVGRLIEREVTSLPAVRSTVLTTGNTGALDMDVGEGGRTGPEYGQLSVELVDGAERGRSQSEIVTELRDRIQRFAGVEIDVEELGQGPPVGAALVVRVSGRDLREIEAATRQVRARIGGLPGVQDVRTDYERGKPEVRVAVDRARAAGLYGVTPEQVARALGTAFHGSHVGQMWVGPERVDIRLEANEQFARTVENVRELGVRATSGEIVPIGELADVGMSFAHNAVFRFDGLRAITVSADAAPDVSSVALEQAARASLAELALPPGVRIAFGGESEERERSYASLWSALRWGLLLIYFIMAVQFNSIRQPAIILLAIPLALVGVVLGLVATGTPFSFMVFMGIVSLTGIVVNDGIVLVDGINQARAEGMALLNAIRDTAVRRLRPVLLTTVTTILGLLPLTLNLTRGGEYWVPLGIAVISGLLVASALTLVFVPVLYAVLEGPWLRAAPYRIEAGRAPAGLQQEQ